MTETSRFWNYNPAKGHDKIYELTVMSVGMDTGKFDVIAEYGRRKGRMAFHVHAEGVSKEKALAVFEQVKRTRFQHGYTQEPPVAALLETKQTLPAIAIKAASEAWANQAAPVNLKEEL